MSRINSLEKCLLEKLMHGLEEDDFLIEEPMLEKIEQEEDSVMQ